MLQNLYEETYQTLFKDRNQAPNKRKDNVLRWGNLIA